MGAISLRSKSRNCWWRISACFSELYARKVIFPKPWVSGCKDNRLNRAFGRGGGDRNDECLNKACALNALQPAIPANRNKRNKRTDLLIPNYRSKTI